VARGWSEEEVIDDLRHLLRIDLASMTVRDRRLYLEQEDRWREEVRHFMAAAGDNLVPTVIPEATSENVQAERDRRIRAGERHGYDALAEHFVTTPETIRRRLGKLK
jgi:hypothetical protein